MRFKLSVVCFLFVFTGYSQKCNKRYVVDRKTNEPLTGVHVFTSLTNGVLTNLEGAFRFCPQKSFIEFSHIGYKTELLYSEGIPDTIKLGQELHKLEVVTVHGLNAIQTLHTVIDSLHRNYYVEPIQYEVYIRSMVLGYQAEELLVFSEFLIDTYINAKSNTHFRVIKGRVKSFSEEGDFYMKDMRMIRAISSSLGHLLSYPSDFLKRNKLKNFIVSFEDSQSPHLTKLRVQSKKERYYFILLIDNKSYAIKQVSRVYPKRGTKTVTSFKEISGKWYLFKESSIGISYGNGKRQTKNETVAVFRICPEVNYSKKEFKNYVNIVAEPVEWYNHNWDDPEWDRFSRDIPKWIQKVINSTQ